MSIDLMRRDGVDGKWSTFTLRVGTPAQNARVLISTASQSTWLVIPQGCDDEDTSCQENRGGTFDYNSSSTWALQGSYPLSTESSLQIDDDGLWGNDTLGLGIQGGGGPTLNKQIIAGVTTKDIYVGMFGVNSKPAEYNGEQHDSYMTSLKRQNLIPSTTFGYTAGASYRLKHVLGSLTLGGYDRSRFTPNAHSFSFAPEGERELVIGVQRIDYTSTNGTTSSLLTKGIRANVDSTTPYIYLPLEACEAFEKAFDLEYNATMELYPVSNSLHSRLIAQNASITFGLGDDTSGGETVNITLPYDSFDLTAEFPVVEESTMFFPLKRAINETQYTLGRTFLQEAYLIVDYERKNFSISQCTFEDGMTENLVGISPVAFSNTTLPSDNESSSSTSTTIIGVAVGISVLALIIGAGGVSLFVRKKRQARRRAKEAQDVQDRATQEAAEKIKQGINKVELGELGQTRYEIGGSEVVKPRFEADGPSLISEKAHYFDERLGKHEYTSSDTKRAELPTGGAPFYELGEFSAAPVELPADMPRELPTSNPSRRSSRLTPRSTRGTPPQSSVGASPFSDPPAQPTSRSSGSPRPPSQPSVIETQIGKLPTRSSTLNSLGFAPSSPSFSGPSSPTDQSRQSDNHSESAYSPISPMRSSEGGLSPTDGGPSPATPSPGGSNRGRRSPRIAASRSDDSRRRERRRKDETE